MIRGDDYRSLQAEQDADDMMVEDAFLYKATDDLTYNHYAWQRSHYGISAERMAPHYPRADKYEAHGESGVILALVLTVIACILACAFIAAWIATGEK